MSNTTGYQHQAAIMESAVIFCLDHHHIGMLQALVREVNHFIAVGKCINHINIVNIHSIIREDVLVSSMTSAIIVDYDGKMVYDK